MSQATFTVTLKLPVTDMTTLAQTADDIKDELESAGMEVVSCDPWARPSDQSAPQAGLPDATRGLPNLPFG